MCGLVGIAGTITDKEEKAFRTMLVMDSVRGEHSTGVLGVGRHAAPMVVKSVGDPFALFGMASWEKLMKRNNRVLLGHNRYATQGNITRGNAHPFEFDKVIGAHNGTLINKGVLHNGSDFPVDSQALYNHIDMFGVKDAVKNLNGAWALTWWNSEDDTINFLRNDQRPLFTALSTAGNTIFWASEKWMISVACSRNGIGIGEISELHEDRHVSIKIPANYALLKDHIFVEEVASEYVPFVQNQGIFHNTRSVWTGTNTSTAGASNGPAVETSTYLDTKKKDTFANTPNVVVWVTSPTVEMDGNGALYVIAHTMHTACKHPMRLHVRDQAEAKSFAGKRFMCTIGQLHCNPKAGMYYKIEKSSLVVLAGATVKPEEKKVEPEPVKEEDPNQIEFEYGPSNEQMSVKDWEEEFGRCAWCTGEVKRGSGYRYVRNCRDAVCEDCANDPEVTEYVNLM